MFRTAPYTERANQRQQDQKSHDRVETSKRLITSAIDLTANRHLYSPRSRLPTRKMFYLFSFVSFLTLIALVGYYHRRAIAPHLPARMQHYMPLSSFEDQRDAGLTSAHFDIESLNIAAGDSRSGLDETGAAEVQRIMQEERVGFDEARLIRQKRYLAANGIDPNTGMPLDSKAVTRL